MMTEADQPDIVGQNVDVALQLQDAAQTDVTNNDPSSSLKNTATYPPQQVGYTPPGVPQVSANVTMYTPYASPQGYSPTQPMFNPGVATGQQYQISNPAAYPGSGSPGVMQSPHDTCASIQIDDGYSPGGGSMSQPASSNGLLGWGRGFMSKVVEKTKTSVETMITTLDPQMKQVIYSGGDLAVVVTSSKEAKVTPVRDAFLTVFGRATVTGQDCQSNTAPQPVGFTSGCKGAEDRIQHFRTSSACYGNEVLVSIEGFVVEILPERWYEMSCLLLVDPTRNIQVQTFSQPTPLPTDVIAYMQESTPPDFPLRWSGLATTVGEALTRLVPGTNHSMWQTVLIGVSREETLALAAKALVTLYKGQLPTFQTYNT